MMAPTLIIDEADTYLARHKELMGILNTGHHRKSAWVTRTEKHNGRYTTQRYSTFAPIAIGGIGNFSPALESRAIIIPMRRKAPGENLAELSEFDEIANQRFRDLSSMAARWADDHFDELRAAHPQIPAGITTRAKDNCRILIAIADLAGQHWPRTARQAVIALSGSGEISPPEILLGDIRDAFGDRTRVATAALVDELTQLEYRPYGRLDQHELARRLAPFGVRPKMMKIDGRGVRAYERTAFDDVFIRYAPPSLRG
jgi:hypothetical protein